MSTTHLTDCGIPAVGKIPWGSHFCHFFSRREDLVHGLVPYFAAGLANRERCIWITSSPLSTDDARKELEMRMPNLGALLNERQIRILDSSNWYTSAKSTVKEDLLAYWFREETDALRAGYEGLRVAGNASFLERAQWSAFMAYEGAANREIRSRRVIALCSYDLKKSSATDVFDVIRNHQFTLDRQGDSWEVVETVNRPLGM
jgi:MEDS: MEthanogen/methylotroph, DcmR Sensory domain